jgi:hypothetical protein
MYRDGAWEELTDWENPTLRVLAVPSYQTGFLEGAQCAFFNYTLDYYG